MSDILSISSNAVGIYQRVLTTVSDNISNVGNPNYVRQDSSITQLPSQYDGRAYQGSGAIFNGVRRLFDEFIENRLRQAKSDVNSSQTLVKYAQQITNILGGQSTGLNAALDKFFVATSALAADPAANIARTNFLTSAQSLAARTRDIAANFKRFDTESQAAAKTAVGQVNVIAKQLANVNGQLFKHHTLDKQPASLLNQRDELLRELASYMDFQSSFDTAGLVKIGIGGMGSSGTIVDGIHSQTLDVQFKDGGAEQMDLILDPWGNQARVLSGVTGGEYGGILEFRTRMLDPAMNELDSFIKALAIEVNKVHQSGVDARGQVGGEIFSFIPKFNVTKTGSDNATQVNAVVTDSKFLSSKPITMTFDALAGKTYTTALTGPFERGDQIQVTLNGRSRTMTVTESNPSIENVIGNLKTFIDGESDVGINGELGFGTQLRAVVGTKGELSISSPILKDYNFNISVASAKARAQIESNQGIWIATDPSNGLQVTGVNYLNLAGLSIDISGTPKNGEQITISPENRPASAFEATINDPAKVATASAFGIRSGLQNISTTQARIYDAMDIQGVVFQDQVLGGKNAVSNNAAPSASLTWDATSLSPASVIPAGVENITYYLDSNSSIAELQILTKNGQHVVGKPMTDGQTFIKSSSGFESNSSYANAYLNTNYRGMNVFYGAKSKPQIFNPIGVDHLPRAPVKLDANLKSDYQINSTGIEAIPAGAFTLNGYSMTAFNGGGVDDIVTWINANSNNTGIIAHNDNGYISMTRSASNGNGAIELGFGNYTDQNGNSLVGTPRMLANLGFRTTAQIDGRVAEDLLVFVTGQGTAKVAATWEGQVSTISDKRETLRTQSLEIQFTSSSHYIVKDLKYNNIIAERDFTVNQPIDIFGLHIAFDESPSRGDSFMITGNESAVGDNTNILRIANLKNAKIAGSDGSLTLSEAYFSLIDKLGNLTSESQIGFKSFEAIEQDAINAKESVSGVNLDEEAASLIRYQQAYQAAAKSMQVANQLFESLIQI